MSSFGGVSSIATVFLDWEMKMEDKNRKQGKEMQKEETYILKFDI